MTRSGGSGQPIVHLGGPDRPALAARRRKATVKSPSRTRRWIFLSVAVVALVAGAVLLLRSGDESPAAASATGTLTPERISHDFGQVSMGGGILSTRFPLAVDSDALVTDVLTS